VNIWNGMVGFCEYSSMFDCILVCASVGWDAWCGVRYME
jgi:hypothetical protein